MIYEINPTKTALLVIDMQKEYFDAGRPLATPNGDAIRGNVTQLRDELADAGCHIVIVQHVHKADGSDVGRMGDFDPTPLFIEGTPAVNLLDEFVPRQGEALITKTRYSAFVGTDLDEQLKRWGVDTIIVTGMMTNYCCVTTARHGHDLDYRVLFVSDANAGPNMPDLGFGEWEHSALLKSIATSLAGGVAEVVSSEEILRRVGLHQESATAT